MIDSVSSLFSDKVSIQIHSRLAQPPFLIIVEDGYNSAIKRLCISDLPENSYAITLDVSTSKFTDDEKIQFSRLNHYLDKSNKTGINTRCDLVLFTEEGEAENIYILDLKSSDPNPKDVCMQLVNSEIYIKYILELAKFFYKKNISEISFFKIVCTTRVRKQVTYANVELREKIAKRKKLYEDHDIKELKVLPGSDFKADLQFSELTRLF